MHTTPLPTIDVAGVPFYAGTVDALATHICTRAAAGGGWVVTPNLDILRRWHCDASFRLLVGSADVYTPDGAPIVWASRLQGQPLPGRVAGSDLFNTLYARAARQSLRMLLIGGDAGAAAGAVRRLTVQHALPPHAVRTHCPPRGFEHNAHERRAIAQLLTEFRPQLVFVGLGCPKQENLIAQLRRLHPTAWYLGVGASFSFAAGQVPRAPRWMQRSGLEWLHRLLQEPGRLARRYLVDDLPYAALLLARSALRRLAPISTLTAPRAAANTLESDP